MNLSKLLTDACHQFFHESLSDNFSQGLISLRESVELFDVSNFTELEIRSLVRFALLQRAKDIVYTHWNGKEDISDHFAECLGRAATTWVEKSSLEGDFLSITDKIFQKEED